MFARFSDASGNLQGSMYMLFAMASFAVGDAIMKSVSTALPLSQILVIRGSFACVGFLAIAKLTGAMRPLSAAFKAPIVLRITGEIIATYFFLTALFNMPIANATAILQALPLTVSLGAAWFLGEPIGWRRIVAIVLGFFGVLLIVKPGLAGFSVFSVFCLVAVFGATLRDLATRRIDEDVPSVYVSLVTVFMTVVFAIVLIPFQPWQPIGIYEISILGVASVFLMSGFISIVSAMRVGEVPVVTPLRYSVLVFAVIIGFLVFDEWPDMLTIGGSIIVVASGLFTLYRETVTTKHRDRNRS